MIPYELIICSASRPHLLRQTLYTLLSYVDQLPVRILIHDDAVFPGKRPEIEQVVRQCLVVASENLLSYPNGTVIPTTVLEFADPPARHGPALWWLLQQVQTEYVLYSQDDHKVKRPLPVASALSLLNVFHLNQIRFNKRDTMDVKGEGPQAFRKVERQYQVYEDAVRDGLADAPLLATLCAADHWYFQTGVWRVAAIKPVVDWWYQHGPGAFAEHMEVKINQVFNGEYRQWHQPFPPEVPILIEEHGAWNDPETRARIHKTFIWGKVGERAYVEHIGTDPNDWALERSNRDIPSKEPK